MPGGSTVICETVSVAQNACSIRYVSIWHHGKSLEEVTKRVLWSNSGL